MASKIVNLNVAALGFIGDNTKLRVRTVDGLLQVRPTSRVLASNLPEGETLRPVYFKRAGDKVEGAKFGLPGSELEIGARFEVAKGKYGWFALTPVTDAIAKGTPAARVSKA
jgi:hypothetical protein